LTLLFFLYVPVYVGLVVWSPWQPVLGESGLLVDIAFGILFPASAIYCTSLGFNLRPKLRSFYFILILGALGLLGKFNAHIISKYFRGNIFEMWIEHFGITQFIIIAAVVKPIGEELFFRQLMYKILKNSSWSRRTVLLVTSLTFAALHFGYVIYAEELGMKQNLAMLIVFNAFLLGLFFGQAREVTESPIGSYLSHFLYNSILALQLFTSMAT
jgi:membrane protease YdiL (CAAX protease family)